MKGAKNKTLSLNGTAVKAVTSYSKQTGETIDGRELLKRSDASNRLVQQLLNEMYDNLVEILYNVQVSLDPEIMILGGGISARKELTQEIAKRLEVLLRNEGVGEVLPQIACCHYQNNTNLLGAALNYMNQQEKITLVRKLKKQM